MITLNKPFAELTVGDMAGLSKEEIQEIIDNAPVRTRSIYEVAEEAARQFFQHSQL